MKDYSKNLNKTMVGELKKMSGTNEQEKGTRETEDIFDSGFMETQGTEGTFYCLTIIGQIEGHYALESNQKSTKYDHVIPLLVALEENEKVDGILILLNTLGGDVEAGLAIAEVIASLKKPTVSVVLGGGHSIGVPLAVSADKSFIVPSATMTIHPVRTTGLVLGVPQAFDYLQKMQNRIIKFITSHSRVKEEVFRDFITATDMLVNDIGTILDGTEATLCGLIDEIGGISDALSYLKERKKSQKS